jgi:hypothetical protein
MTRAGGGTTPTSSAAITAAGRPIEEVCAIDSAAAPTKTSLGERVIHWLLIEPSGRRGISPRIPFSQVLD